MADAHDITPHVQMWRNFTRLMGFSFAGIMFLLAMMALFFT